MNELTKPGKGYWLSPEGLSLIQGWARDGFTDALIAERMGISRKALWVWRGKHPELASAMRSGKEVADYAVESALFKNAIEGNVTAQIFWLKNRKPGQWNEKHLGEQEQEHSIEIRIIRKESPVDENDDISEG